MILEKKKPKETMRGCVDITVCFLQATMVSVAPAGGLHLMALCLPKDTGEVFFFLVLDHEER